MDRKAVRWTAVLAVLALAAVLRIYDLRDVPAGLFCDEAGLGYNAYALGTAGMDENGRRWPLYVWSFGVSYKNPIFIYAAIIPVKLLGLDELSIRLTSALFGIGTVAAVFWLGRVLFTPWVGLWAALFLAVCPWHLHFSRIAFELISFPFLFVGGCALLVCYTHGRRTLPAALCLFGLCIYSYAIAALFVPLFLLGFGLLYLPTVLRRWKETLLALVVVAAILAPAATFFSQQRRAGTQYFRRTTFVDVDQDWRPQAERFVRNYRQFFSRGFLFEHGDRLRRHAVRGFGELHTFYLPFLLLGAGVALLRFDRASKLLLWWLALYPVGPSLMTEIPSASRGFIGVPVFCLLTAIGFAAALRALRWLLRWRPLVLTAQTVAVAAAAGVLGPQVMLYVAAYFVDYPTYSALTPGGFQYGYRDMIRYMESERGSYDRLMITATDTNQPKIFPMFYRRIDPRDWIARRNTGYQILKPAEFSRYSMNKRILFALHPSDVDLFSDFTVKRRITAPGGQLAYVIADVRARKRYLPHWLGLGLFANDDGAGISRDFIDPGNLRRGQVSGAFGRVGWQSIWQQFVNVDLNRAYAGGDPRHPGNPERVCAYAVTTVRSPNARRARIELDGSLNDSLRVWLDGRLLTPWPLKMDEIPRNRAITLREGANVLLVQSCEDIGHWYFNVRITDDEGRDMADLDTVAELAPVLAPRVDPEDTAIQLLEGFEAVGEFTHHEPRYRDYRGGAESWRARVHDGSAVTWRTAPPQDSRRAVMAFTASTSDEEGDFKLFVDGRYAVTFQSSSDHGVRNWEREGYHLTFVSKGGAAGNTGVFLLAVPAGRVTAGQPFDLRVEPDGGNQHAWFMIKAYGDTIEHDGITPAIAVETIAGSWRRRELPYGP